MIQIKFSSPARLAWAGIKLAYARLRGFRILATDWEAACRVQICAECPAFNAASQQCRICTCDVELKSLLATESCPLGKWGSIWVAKKA